MGFKPVGEEEMRAMPSQVLEELVWHWAKKGDERAQNVAGWLKSAEKKSNGYHTEIGINKKLFWSLALIGDKARGLKALKEAVSVREIVETELVNNKQYHMSHQLDTEFNAALGQALCLALKKGNLELAQAWGEKAKNPAGEWKDQTELPKSVMETALETGAIELAQEWAEKDWGAKQRKEMVSANGVLMSLIKTKEEERQGRGYHAQQEKEKAEPTQEELDLAERRRESALALIEGLCAAGWANAISVDLGVRLLAQESGFKEKTEKFLGTDWVRSVMTPAVADSRQFHEQVSVFLKLAKVSHPELELAANLVDWASVERGEKGKWPYDGTAFMKALKADLSGHALFLAARSALNQGAKKGEGAKTALGLASEGAWVFKNGSSKKKGDVLALMLVMGKADLAKDWLKLLPGAPRQYAKDAVKYLKKAQQEAAGTTLASWEDVLISLELEGKSPKKGSGLPQSEPEKEGPVAAPKKMRI